MWKKYRQLPLLSVWYSKLYSLAFNSQASKPGRGENGGGNDCFLLKLFLYFLRAGDDILDI